MQKFGRTIPTIRKMKNWKDSMSMTACSSGTIILLLKDILGYLFTPFQGSSVNWGSLLFLSLCTKATGLSCCTVSPSHAMALSELRNPTFRTPGHTLFCTHLCNIYTNLLVTAHEFISQKKFALSQGNSHWKMNIWMFKSSSSLAIPHSSVTFEYESFRCCIKYLMFF